MRGRKKLESLRGLRPGSRLSVAPGKQYRVPCNYYYYSYYVCTPYITQSILIPLQY